VSSTKIDTKSLRRKADRLYTRKARCTFQGITSNFLEKVRSDPQVRLDSLALELDCQKRRLYDLVNILEGLGLVAREKKAVYRWLGWSCFGQPLASRPSTLATLTRQLLSDLLQHQTFDQVVDRAITANPQIL
jgi:hypothetical protein